MDIKEISKKEYSRILVADSCAGGITVLKHLTTYFPKAFFTFLADGQKNPFGIKSKKEIIDIIEDWLKYSNTNNFDLLVVACNTASIAIVDEISRLEEKYNISIITMIDSLVNACEVNLHLINNKNIMLFGTNFTVSSEIYVNIIEKYNCKNIYRLPGTESEKMVAKGLLDDVVQQKKVCDEIGLFENYNIDTVILACTCFEFVKQIIEKQYKNIQFINLNETLLPVNNKNYSLIDYNLDNIAFVTTGEMEKWCININIIANKVFGQDVKIKKINIR